MEISTLLNALSLDNLKRIITILNLECNINTKEEIIDSIIDKEEIYWFLDIIENIRFNQNNSINNNILNGKNQDDESDKSEKFDLSLNSKLEKINLGNIKPKKRNYNDMINNYSLKNSKFIEMKETIGNMQFLK